MSDDERTPDDERKPRPWESEEAAFAFLLRVLAVFAVLVVIILLVKALA